MVTERQVMAMLAGLERMELYCAAYPGTPSAIRRPRLLKRGKHWTALVGRNPKDEIIGIGPTVEMALRAFDHNYLMTTRPPRQ